MGNRLKKILCAALALLCLAGCGKGPAANSTAGTAQDAAPSDTAAAGEYELTLTAELLDLPDGMAYASAQCRVGDTVWLGGTAEAGAVMGWISLDGGSSELTAMPDGCDFIYAMCPSGDNIAVLAGTVPMYYEDAQGKTTHTGEPEGRLELLIFDGTDFVSETQLAERYVSTFHSILELDGSFYILCQDKLIKLAPDGTELARFDHGERNVLMQSMRLYNGELAAAARDLNILGFKLYRLDPDTLNLNGEEEISEAIITGMGLANDTLVVDTGTNVATLDESFQLGEPAFYWAQLFISGGYQEIEELSDGYLFFDPYQRQVCCARWKQTKVRKTVVIATDADYGDVFTLANEFNRIQSEYRLELKIYDTYDEGAQTRLRTEIGAGNWPDILAFSHMDTLADIRHDSTLTDLYAYLDADSELGREDFVPSLITAMEEHGALYWLAQSFWITTMMAPSALIPEPGVSVEQVLHTARDNRLVPVEQWITREAMLSWYSIAAEHEYVDWETGTCSFDSEGFVHLLELCNLLFSSDHVIDGELYTGPHDPALLSQYIIQSPSNIATLKESRGNDYCFAGFPETMGNGSILWPQLKFAITAGAQEKEGAWEFISFACSGRGQENLHSAISSNTSMLDMELSELVKNGWTDYHGDKHEFSENDAQKFRELVDGAEMIYSSDPTLEKIISDCAAAYFAGDKTAEQAAADIQARASIYVAERG